MEVQEETLAWRMLDSTTNLSFPVVDFFELKMELENSLFEVSINRKEICSRLALPCRNYFETHVPS